MFVRRRAGVGRNPPAAAGVAARLPLRGGGLHRPQRTGVPAPGPSPPSPAGRQRSRVNEPARPGRGACCPRGTAAEGAPRAPRGPPSANPQGPSGRRKVRKQPGPAPPPIPAPPPQPSSSPSAQLLPQPGSSPSAHSSPHGGGGGSGADRHRPIFTREAPRERPGGWAATGQLSREAAPAPGPSRYRRGRARRPGGRPPSPLTLPPDCRSRPKALHTGPGGPS